MVVRPARMYVLEPVARTKRQEAELLRFSLGVARMDKTINKYIRGKAQVQWFLDTVKEETLRCFGHVKRRGS